MAQSQREIERKYEARPGLEDVALPDLAGVGQVAVVRDIGAIDLDAVYYDTADLRLAAHGITLRRRTGGADEGWHLKLPVAEGERDELRSPLDDRIPGELAALVRAVTRDAPLAPLLALRTARRTQQLLDKEGTLLAEAVVDQVHADRPGVGTSDWTEAEVELADGAPRSLLDKVEKRLRKSGLGRSEAPSKLAAALARTEPSAKPPEPRAAGDRAGDHVLRYLYEQRDALVRLDAEVRRDLPDSVHRMRVATRRMRSTFRSYSKVLDRAVTDPLGDELKWLAGELGADRDMEVVGERLTTVLDGLPSEVVRGPVPARVDSWAAARRSGSRQRLLETLDGERYLALLNRIDEVLAAPPLRKAAGKRAPKVLAQAVGGQFDRVAALIAEAEGHEPGPAKDTALHEARKKAKRTRYAAEASAPVLGSAAKRLVKQVKALQDVLGEHQDSVLVRDLLPSLADAAAEAGESEFTYGLFHGREEQRAADCEARLPAVWKRTERRARKVSKAA